jgi:hypothetical protein
MSVASAEPQWDVIKLDDEAKRKIAYLLGMHPTTVDIEASISGGWYSAGVDVVVRSGPETRTIGWGVFDGQERYYQEQTVAVPFVDQQLAYHVSIASDDCHPFTDRHVTCDLEVRGMPIRMKASLSGDHWRQSFAQQVGREKDDRVVLNVNGLGVMMPANVTDSLAKVESRPSGIPAGWVVQTATIAGIVLKSAGDEYDQIKRPQHAKRVRLPAAVA